MANSGEQVCTNRVILLCTPILCIFASVALVLALFNTGMFKRVEGIEKALWTEYDIRTQRDLAVGGEYQLISPSHHLLDIIHSEPSFIPPELNVVFGSADFRSIILDSNRNHWLRSNLSSFLPLRLPNNFFIFQNPNFAIIQPRTVFLNGVFVVSDERFKTSITILDTKQSLLDLQQLQPSSFFLLNSKSQKLGFIAQNVEAVIPQAIYEIQEKDLDGNFDEYRKAKAVDQTAILALLTSALQQIVQEVESLKQELANLKNQP